MIRFAFDYPLVLASTPFALSPLFRSPLRASKAPSIEAIPVDLLSYWIAIATENLRHRRDRAPPSSAPPGRFVSEARSNAWAKARKSSS